MRAEPLRDDAFTAERAGMFEDGRAIADEMLIEGNTVADASEELGEPRLALLERLPAEVGAVELDQVERA
jgi:hypothetical protein